MLKSIPEILQNGYVDPFTVAEHYGVVVRRAALSDSLSGFLVRDEAGNAFIGVNEHDVPNRQRFTVAHELGHHFLHDHSEVYLDTSIGSITVLARDESSSEGTNVQEIEANLFAAELLMPSSQVEFDVRAFKVIDLFGEDSNDSVISFLATKYKVSVRAMTIRLERLGYLAHI